MLWLIDYENMHWCGGQLNVVVEASDEDEARIKASDFMEEQQYNLFYDHIEEAVAEGEMEEGESQVAINSVVEFNEDHKEWKFFVDPTQSEFYPVID